MRVATMNEPPSRPDLDAALDLIRDWALARYGAEFRPFRLTLHLLDNKTREVEEVKLPICCPLAVVRAERPPPPSEPDCAAAVILTLREVGHRLTLSPLLAEMERRGRLFGESTVKHILQRLVRDGTVDNNQTASPRGYGLTEWAEQ